jgi:hypothetical protein
MTMPDAMFYIPIAARINFSPSTSTNPHEQHTPQSYSKTNPNDRKPIPNNHNIEYQDAER